MLSGCLGLLPFKLWWGAGGGGFVFLSANGKAQGTLLLFLLSLGDVKDFFFNFHWISMCSQYVPQVLNVFPNMFSI